MILSVAFSGVTMTIYLICMTYAIADDMDKILNTPTKSPMIEFYFEITKSKAGTNILVSAIIFLTALASFNDFASTSRLVWAFAADRGLPCGRFLSRVSKHHVSADTASSVSQTDCKMRGVGPSKVACSSKFTSPGYYHLRSFGPPSHWQPDRIFYTDVTATDRFDYLIFQPNPVHYDTQAARKAS
jgi:Amino acid permease